MGMGNRSIRAVIFDGGGVFSLSADTGGQRYWEYKLELPSGGLRRLITPEINRQANLGLISEEQVWELALAPLHLDTATRAAISIDFWAGAYLDYDMALLIEQVHEAGYQTALLSNAWIGARASHTALGWDRLLTFDVQLFSAEEGLMKPDPRFFQRCLDYLKISAKEAVFIDDTLVNVEAARELGMLSIHYIDKGKQMAEIRQLLRIRQAATTASTPLTPKKNSPSR
jgi:2-haloacid dehalogenase